MMDLSKFNKYVENHPTFKWSGNYDLDSDRKNDIILYNQYGEQVWFNYLHIGNNTKIRQIYNYYDDTFNKQDPYYNFRRMYDK